MCDSCRIQTCNLLIRSQMLYSIELTNHAFRSRFASAKLLLFLDISKYRKKNLEKLFRQRDYRELPGADARCHELPLAARRHFRTFGSQIQE